MLRIIVQNDQGRKAELPLESSEVTIGRGDENTVKLDDRNVSRRHARLRQIEDSYVLEDLGSSNGIWINGTRLVGNIFVKGGDSFRLGDYEVVVAEDSENGTAARPTTDFPEEVNLQGLTQEQGPRWVDLEKAAARLILTNTAANGREFPLIRPVMQVGSDPASDIQIDDRSVSSHHARIERLQSGDWQIYDLDSSGMAINGHRKAIAKLESGDEIVLGKVNFTFVGPDGKGPLLPSGEVMSRPGQRLKAVLFLALVASFAGIGGGVLVLLWMKNQPGLGVSPVATQSETETSSQESKIAAYPNEEPKVGRATALEPIPAPTAPIVKYEPKLFAARAAMARKDFRRVVDILSPLHYSDGSRPSDAEELMEHATTELRAKRSLSLAQKNLSVGRLEEAGRFLEEASDTRAYAREYRQLRARAETLTALRQAKRSHAKDSLEGRPAAPARVALAKLDEPRLATEEPLRPAEPKSAELKTAPEATPPPAVPELTPAPPLTPAELAAIASIERRPPPREHRNADPGAWIVVAHPTVKASLSQSELRQIFSGESVPSQGGRIMQLVLVPAGTAARQKFMSEGIGRTEAQFKAAWTRLVFRGSGVRPPLEMNDDASVVAAIASRPGAIGVVREGTDLSGVTRVRVR